jgi:hypothetical protein
MISSNANPPCERTVEAMIEFGHCSKRQRIIVSGPTRSQLMFELHRRGYRRVATTATSGLPQGQYDAALVDWGDQSLKSLETTLNWLVHFLDAAAVLVVRLDSRRRGVSRKLESLLEWLGFRVEARGRGGHGVVVSSRRRDRAGLSVAA